MADITFNLSTQDKFFKVLYEKKSYAVFNTANKLLMKVKKEYNFQGKNKTIEAVLGFSGGVGAGSLPETNVHQEENAVLTRKKLYARTLLDREAMLASKNQGAFEDASKRQVSKAVESFMRNLSRQLFAFENGMLFQGDNATVVTGTGTSVDPYIVRALASTFVKGFIEKKDYVNVGAETTQLEITAVNYSTRDISLVGTSATLAAASGGGLATNAKVYMQKSKDNDLQSILAAVKASGGTLYGITVGPRWQSVQINAANAGITIDLINQCIGDIEFQAGKSPDIIVTSFKQLRKVKNLLDDKLRYCLVSPRDPMFKKAGASFQAVEIQTDAGPIAMIADRMCPDDHMFFLNTEDIVLYGVEPPKWVDEDGRVLLRSSSADSFEARYAMYGELFIHPNSQGVIYNLA